MSEVSLKNRLAVRERPNEIPIMHQRWQNLLFLHWAYDQDKIQNTLPPGLKVDTFQGKAYITMSPFSMKDLSVAFLPPIPGIDSYIEVNVRTYVYDKNDTPGIWFYSLDLNSFYFSKLARKTFSLPYFYSDLNAKSYLNRMNIEGKRIDQPETKINFSYNLAYENNYEAEVESLEFFLIERYVLFSFESNQLNFGKVNHQPYKISNAEVFEYNSNLLKVNSFEIEGKQPNAMHFCKDIEVDIFSLKSVY
jgi:uncharacterized protein YqjF (DUF2071 family)